MTLKVAGYFDVECVNPDGTLAWREEVKNSPTLAGLTHILGVAFNSVTQITSWYLGLVDNASFSSFSTGDVMSSHAGWSEVTTYSSSTRPQWTPLSVASGVAINSTEISFVITTAQSLKGLFLASNSTKGGTTGTLWATGAFAAVRDVVPNQTFKINYRVRATGGS